MKNYIYILILLFTACTTMPMTSNAQRNPKREFRGAWIQCVNGQFIGLGRDQMQQTLTQQLDELQRCGINAIIFQVRPEGDALYESKLEPWSRFLTGQQGTAPSPYWDPLAWMIEQCHRRGMECHAWINPFRAKTKATTAIAATHLYNKYPERFFFYDNLIIFDPGQPENRNYICHVAGDILRRYDVDGLHIDDYFYPYPVPGLKIPDEATFARHGRGFASIEDWRRDNVNQFIKQLCDTVHTVKPWAKFGVSPFGIYRNEKSHPDGSRTDGLQNYDDLYADVLLWAKEGWIDYNIPQIYWEIGHKRADYNELVRWWNDHNEGGRLLYIGQDVERTIKSSDLANPQLNQMQAKYTLQRALANISGSCQWYAKAVCDNPQTYGNVLKQVYHSTLALQPLMPWLDAKAPEKVKKMKAMWMPDGYVLFWTAPKAKNIMDEAHMYAVYRFADKEEIDISNSNHLVAITSNNFYKLPYRDGKKKWVYVVTALDRLQNESKPTIKKIKL